MYTRCYFINLKRRPDRLENFRRLQTENGWNLPEPIIFAALDGNKIGTPSHFKSGGGAWGCLSITLPYLGGLRHGRRGERSCAGR